MYVRVRHLSGNSKHDWIFVISKTSTIGDLKNDVSKRLNVDVDKQKLYYNGKLLVDEHTIMDYSIRLNDVIQLMEKCGVIEEAPKSQKKDTETPVAVTEPEEPTVEAESCYYKKGDLIDVIDDQIGGWFEAKILGIFEKSSDKQTTSDEGIEDNLVFRIQMETNRNEEVAPIDAVFSDIRPRSYYTFPTSELKPDMVVLVNYNIEEPKERGYWYDFKVVDSTRKVLKGTLLLGKDHTVVESINVKFKNEVMRIEQVTLLTERDDEENTKKVALRKLPFYCNHCRDEPKKNCKFCGCHVCSKKTDAKSLLMCDECDRAFHLRCLDPPLSEVPSDPEWYCRECKVDDSEIVKAGEMLKPSNKKQKMASVKNKENGKNRDWGQGMACVGRTSVCTIVPPEHSGPVPGIEVGTCWKFRIQVSEAGIHRPHVAGIHGREADGAYSIVLSGGYEDDIDNGNEFYYTGSGGRDLSGNKRISEQSSNQELTRMNKALAVNCNVKLNNKTGGDAGKDWRKGKPVRVVRNYKLAKHSKYAPKDGNRYDGIYKVVKYYPEKGKSGFIVWRYLLRRDDPSPAPWEKGGQELPIILPPGYLEAQEIKNNSTKKRKSTAPLDARKTVKIQKTEPFDLSDEVRNVIDDDFVNQKAWKECLQTLQEGKQKFLAKIEELFLCVCCQDLVLDPVTTVCAHNVCQKCLQRSFDANIQTCPNCRFDLSKGIDLKDINEALSETLRTLFPGYETGR